MRLSDLETKYGNRYSFKFEGEFYIRVKPLKSLSASEIDHDVIEMYKAFFFEDFDNQEKRQTPYVYLNVLDTNYVFLYQLSYNPRTNSFERGNTPYH